MSVVKAGEKGVDFSFARPPAARLVELGYTFVVGYISVPPASPAKNITKAECEAYLAAGLKVPLIWEMSATRATLGGAYGAQDGAAAAAQANLRGYPADCVILAADDCSTTTANLPNKIAYMQEFATSCPPHDMGIYGGVKILKPLVGLWRIGWVTIPAWSWSVSLAKLPNETTAAYNKRGRQAARDAAIAVGAHCLQDTRFYIDNTWAVDPNEAIADFPAWGTGAVPNPQPEDDMATRLVVNRDSGTYGSPYSTSGGGYSVFKLIDNADGVATKKAVGLPEYYANGYINGTQQVVPVDDATLNALPDFAPNPAPVIPAPTLTGKITAELGAAGHITGSLG